MTVSNNYRLYILLIKTFFFSEDRQVANYAIEDVTKSLILERASASESHLRLPPADSINSYTFEQTILSDNVGNLLGNKNINFFNSN